YDLEDGLRKVAVLGIKHRLGDEALRIFQLIRCDRPNIWAFRDAISHQTVFPYIFQVAFDAITNNKPVHEKDLLPKELMPICSRISNKLSGKLFQTKAKERLSKTPSKPLKQGNSNQLYAMTYEEKQRAEQFLSNRLEPLLSLTSAFSKSLLATDKSIDKCFVELIDVWEKIRHIPDQYHSERINHFFNLLGLEVVLFVFWVRYELNAESVRKFLAVINSYDIGVNDIVRIISILAMRGPLQTLAGEQAIKARALIDKEDDVSHRASLYGALSRAMLPASIDEASVYFRNGLEQMDAIGSGDYQFTNELLLFSSQINGAELSEQYFHTLTNICELNMGDEPEKFPWGAFGHGLAKVAGLRGLAKLSR